MTGTKSTIPAAAVGVDAGPTGEFRQAMRRHAASVCIISVGEGDSANGIAVTAATSLSMDPPAVLVCVNQAASISGCLREGAPFGFTVLGQDHEDIAVEFSRGPAGRARFLRGQWHLDGREPPWLENASVNLACVADRVTAYGTHLIVIGLVQRVRLGPDEPNLVYRDGRYL